MKAIPQQQPSGEDRRTMRTKKSLAEALKELILEKPYDDITIQDLIDRANVGRSTFYTHYESKEQLLIGNINFQETLIYVPGNDEENYPMGINVAYLFSHTKEHIDLYKAMSGNRSIDILGNYFVALCTSKIIEHLKRKPAFRKREQMLRYMAAAAAAGLIKMMFNWLDDGARVPATEMTTCAKKILRDFFREGQ